MAKFKVINIDIYKRDITVFIGTHSEFQEWVAQYRVPESWEQLVESIIMSNDDALASYWYNRNNGNGIIELPFHPKTAEEIATAAHEALHATFRVADYVGLEYMPGGSNESFTYLHAFILENIFNYDNYKLINL